MAPPVRIVEVGPRDGLQNEATHIETQAKLSFIGRLVAAGLQEIEATSFVSPKWVPQLADSLELWPKLPTGGTYSALVPNQRGLESALQVGVNRIAVFTAASSAFTEKNINMTVEQSLAAFEEVISRFRSVAPDGWVRGYVSTAFECPYAGIVTPAQVIPVVEKLLSFGVDEISLGDTIGVASPKEVRALTSAVLDVCPVDKLNFHFHDTRGTALANVAQALSQGVVSFDASAAGLGGCPYAKGAGGNLATEDLVYFLEREGIPTGVDQMALAMASLPILEILGRAPMSKAQQSWLASRP